MNHNWLFGRGGAHLFFGGPNVVSVSGPTPHALATDEGCASLSNPATGQLEIYSDGSKVWNRLHAELVTGLGGSVTSTQSVVIVPGSDRRYFVFTTGATGSGNHLGGVRVDLNQGGSVPIASILGGPNPTMPSVAGLANTEKLVAVEQEERRGFWVITVVRAGWNSPDRFRMFRVMTAGNYVVPVADTPIVLVPANAGPVNVKLRDNGHLKVSPTRDRIAVSSSTDRSRVYVFRFDNRNGVIDVANGRSVTIPVDEFTEPYGLEFSPDGRLLYHATAGRQNATNPAALIYQVDLSAQQLTPVQVASYSANPNYGYALGALQLARDGRIYVAKDGEATLGAITSPNTVGAGCGWTPSAVTLAVGGICRLGLPNDPVLVV